MNIMIAFGIASIMLLLGMFLRAKVRFLQNLLLPSSIIAGIAGLLLLNAAEAFSIPLGVETNDFSSIVNPLFVIAFISITLMGAFGGGQPRRNEEYAERRFGDRPDLVSVIYADTADFCNTVPFIRKEFSF